MKLMAEHIDVQRGMPNLVLKTYTVKYMSHIDSLIPELANGNYGQENALLRLSGRKGIKEGFIRLCLFFN